MNVLHKFESPTHALFITCRYAALVMPICATPAALLILSAPQQLDADHGLIMVWTGLVCLMGMRALTILVPFRSKSFVFAAMREETIPWSNNGDSQNDRYLLEGLGSTNMDERMQDPHNHAVLNGSLAEQKPLPEKTSKTEK